MFQPGLILHPTDFSDCSLRAMTLAGDLAVACRARLLIMHVVESTGAENVTFGEVQSQLQPQGYRERLEADLRTLRPAGAEVLVEYLVVDGDAKRQIVRVAQEYHCGLIVMGTHGHTGIRRVVVGSSAEYVVRHAHCPVLTAKIPTVP